MHRNAGVAAAALAVGLGLTAGVRRAGPAEGASPATSAAVVDARDVAAAAASHRPARLTMSDEIAHYEARLARRGEEPFARGRLYAATLLRFRAYGDPADIERAESHLAAWTGGGPDVARYAAATTSLRLAQHRFTDALAVAQAGARSGNGDVAIDHALFDAAWAAGRTAAAEALLARPRDAASIGYMSRRARVLDRQGQVAEARDLLRTVVATVQAYAEPAAVEAWALVELGHFEHHAGDPHEAVRRYREALDVLPGDAAAIEGLAGIARGVDRNADVAAVLYRLALERGGHLDIMPVLADVEEERGRAETARALRAEFVRQATADAQSRRWYRRPLAFVLAESEQSLCDALDLAREDFMQRQDAGAWDAIAWVRYLMGDVAGASAAATAATAEGVPEPPVALRAGIIARAAGDTERSDALLRAALDGRSELSGADLLEATRLMQGGVPAVPAVTRCDAASAWPAPEVA